MPTPVDPAEPQPATDAEKSRLDEAERKIKPWRRWGTYLSERQWGTVREDYSADGSAGIISRTTMPAAAPIAGEKTGIAGFCDEKETLCLAIACGMAKTPS